MLPRAIRSTNNANDLLDIVQGNFVAFENMFALAGLFEQERGAPANHIHPMIDEVADRVMQGEFPRLAIDHREKDHGKALLHLRVLVELVEDDLRFCAALEADDDAHSVAVALVAEVIFRNVGDDFFVDQLGDALDQFGFVDLVGNLGDDDRLPAAL